MFHTISQSKKLFSLFVVISTLLIFGYIGMTHAAPSCSDPDKYADDCDFDGDGIDNIDDIDDDNDGIIDTAEKNIGNTIIGLATPFDFDDGTLNALGTSSLTLSSTTNYVNTQGGAAVPNNKVFVNGYDQAGGGTALQFIFNTPIQISNVQSEVTVDVWFYNDILATNNIANYQTNLNLSLGTTIGTLNGTYTLSNQEKTLLADGNWIPLTFTVPASSSTFNVNSITSDIEMNITGLSPFDVNTSEVFAISPIHIRNDDQNSVPVADTDNDGIPNHLDLNSDNDFCLDADEAGHGKQINGPFGANGFDDNLQSAGVDTILDTSDDQMNYTLKQTGAIGDWINSSIKTCGAAEKGIVSSIDEWLETKLEIMMSNTEGCLDSLVGSIINKKPEHAVQVILTLDGEHNDHVLYPLVHADNTFSSSLTHLGVVDGDYTLTYKVKRSDDVEDIHTTTVRVSHDCNEGAGITNSAQDFFAEDIKEDEEKNSKDTSSENKKKESNLKKQDMDTSTMGEKDRESDTLPASDTQDKQDNWDDVFIQEHPSAEIESVNNFNYLNINTSLGSDVCNNSIINSNGLEKQYSSSIDPEFIQAALLLWKYGLTQYNNIDAFRPSDAIRRDEAAKMLSEFATNILCRQPDTTLDITYKDAADIDATLVSHVVTAYQLGLMKGGKDGYFNPKATISQEELAAIIVRMMKGTYLDETGEHRYSEYTNIIMDNGVVDSFDVSGRTATDREDLGIMLRRVYTNAEFVTDTSTWGYETYTDKKYIGQ